MTHPAQHHVDASKKRQRAWVEGGARGGSPNRPGKAGALKGGASEDRETQSDTRALVPHLRDAKFPPPDTVAGAEEQKERARGGRLMRADGGDTDQLTGDFADRLGKDMRPLTEDADPKMQRKPPHATTDARGEHVFTPDLYQGRDKYNANDSTTHGAKRGGKLTAHDRQKMPSKEFALPGKGEGPGGKGSGSYPIPDLAHGRNALARVSQHGSPEEKAKVRAAVHRKFPDIQEG